MNEFKPNDCFKEAVCVDAMRVFDSCSSQDCLEDLEVTFSSRDQEIVNDATSVKCKCVEVTKVDFAIAAVPFNKGFYTVDITYTFRVDLEVNSSKCKNPNCITGTATFDKKVILFGSDGNTKRFDSQQEEKELTKDCSCGCGESTLPTAVVNVVEPINLDVKLLPVCGCGCGDSQLKTVAVTIGMFAIIQLERSVPMLMPAYDYCIPERESSVSTHSACELFEKIKFPTQEFFPRCLDNDDHDHDHDCCDNKEND